MKILAVDLGKARTGLAICDQGELLASPLEVVTEYNREKLARTVPFGPRDGASDGGAILWTR